LETSWARSRGFQFLASQPASQPAGQPRAANQPAGELVKKRSIEFCGSVYGGSVLSFRSLPYGAKKHRGVFFLVFSINYTIPYRIPKRGSPNQAGLKGLDSSPISAGRFPHHVEVGPPSLQKKPWRSEFAKYGRGFWMVFDGFLMVFLMVVDSLLMVFDGFLMVINHG
jgi:hypothetical protein